MVVLLSLYNGAAFLPAQLDSLDAQTEPGWRLLWRDDGSVDHSAILMQAFAAARGDQVQRLPLPARRLGVGLSFHALAVAAGAGTPIAFCDQDDVWLPDKLARGMTALRGAAGRPALYCARQRLVDASLRPLGLSPAPRRPPDFAMALTHNIATGCTVMMNGAAADLLRAAPPPPGSLHDWWSLLLVTGAGGQVIVDRTPVVLYRQHATNAVGAPSGLIRRAVAALQRGPGSFLTVFAAQLAALERHQALLAPTARAVLARVSAARRGSRRSRAAVLWQTRLRRQTWLETALFAAWFVLPAASVPPREVPDVEPDPG